MSYEEQSGLNSDDVFLSIRVKNGSSQGNHHTIFAAEWLESVKKRLESNNIEEDDYKRCKEGHNILKKLQLASEVIPALVHKLILIDKPEIQFEAACALTNIASTDKTNIVVEVGAVPHFVQLLSSPIAEVRVQSAWCLGIIATYERERG